MWVDDNIFNSGNVFTTAMQHVTFVNVPIGTCNTIIYWSITQRRTNLVPTRENQNVVNKPLIQTPGETVLGFIVISVFNGNLLYIICIAVKKKKKHSTHCTYSVIMIIYIQMDVGICNMKRNRDNRIGWYAVGHWTTFVRLL